MTRKDSPDHRYTGEATVKSVLKHIVKTKNIAPILYHVQSPGSLCGALSVLLGCDMINTCCCLAVAVCVCMRGVGFFLGFLCRPACERCVLFFLFLHTYRPGGPKAPKSFFRKRPGIEVNAPGRLVTLAKS